MRPKGSGKTPGSGRKAGTPNKVNADLKNMIIEALNKAGGAEYLFEQAAENPASFLTLVGKVLPLQVSGEGGGPLQIELVRFDADDPPAA